MYRSNTNCVRADFIAVIQLNIADIINCSQVKMRNYITNIGIIVGSIFWSSLVNSVNIICFAFPKSLQQLASAVVMLIFLLILPFIFDILARYYEGMKLESEIQNSIMTRYFYYQLINVYVTVGFSGNNLWAQLLNILSKPQTLVNIIGGRVPEVSLFFTNLMIVKIFVAVPLEMIRPWQLLSILTMGKFIDKRYVTSVHFSCDLLHWECHSCSLYCVDFFLNFCRNSETTRRELRTGAFYSWPMLYGWIYPQLMMVLMIQLTYCVITPLMMPFCAVFFAFVYVMYKYQLMYVYINNDQSGGFMWYAVFSRSVLVMEFASCCLVGYLSLQLHQDADMSGPFFFSLPLPFVLLYFQRYCDLKFKKQSMVSEWSE
jgi:hypothetical protein